MQEIPVENLTLPVFDLWDNQWLLLTAGTMDDYNMMTVSWGSIGCLWNLPFVQVFVRPHRYTYQFMERYDTFTVCGFPEKYRDDLQVLGTISGKDGDKLSQTALNLIPSSRVPTPGYAEASLILECKKIYHQDMDASGFENQSIHKHYPKHDFHRIYFGEILCAKKAPSAL